MSAEECPHGMGDPDWCSICKHGVTKPEPVVVEYRFTARYDGGCPGCDLPIVPGQRCVMLSKGPPAHEGCEA